MAAQAATMTPTAEADRDIVGRTLRTMEVTTLRRAGGPTSSASSSYTSPGVSISANRWRPRWSRVAIVASRTRSARAASP
jgi:hypothetical protein